jgi:hypothetical protein
VKDDNYANKEYEETNEQSIVTRRWRCIFCWSRRIVSHYGAGRPCYPASGRPVGGLELTLKEENWKYKLTLEFI